MPTPVYLAHLLIRHPTSVFVYRRIDIYEEPKVVPITRPTDGSIQIVSTLIPWDEIVGKQNAIVHIGNSEWFRGVPENITLKTDIGLKGHEPSRTKLRNFAVAQAAKFRLIASKG